VAVVESSKKWICGLPAALLPALLVPFLLRLAFVHVPLERDEGAYAYGAWRMMQGETLYRDVADFSPPVTFALYQLALWIFGHSGEAIRLFAACYVALTALCLFAFTRRLFDRTTAWIAAALFGFLALEPALLGFTANKEIFLLLPLIMGCDWFLRGTRWNGGAHYLLLSGVAFGVGFFVKQQIAPLLGLLVLYGAAESVSRRAWKTAATSALLIASGAACVFATIAAYFLWRGAFADFVYWTFTYPLQFAGFMPLTSENIAFASETALKVLGSMLPSEAIIWLLAAYAGVVLLQRRAPQASFLACMGIGVIAGVSMGLRFRQHYFTLLSPWLAILAARGTTFLFEQLAAERAAHTRTVIATLFVGALVSLPLRTNAEFFFVKSPREISRQLYGGNPFVEAPVIAEYLASTTTEQETIFVIGSEPEIYFYAKRRNPTNQIFFYPLTASYGPTSRYQRETIATLRRAKPTYIIDIDVDTSLYASTPTEDVYVFEELARMIRADYRLDGYVLINLFESAYFFATPAIRPEHFGTKPQAVIYRRRS
jgi:4-amino-4-deoxy-L-arabinose transferase-like glycosyltransferase